MGYENKGNKKSTRVEPQERGNRSSTKNRREDTSEDRDSGREDSGSFKEFAKLMGDNLIALRKMHERPPRWSGPRMKTYKGDPKENFDDFADEVIYGCEKMGLKDDEREKIRYLRGFLEGEAAEFLASIPNKNQQTLKEVLKKIKNRFKDSRTQSDFVYILTTKRHDLKHETIREYSHSLHNLVVKAYPAMPEDQRMQILKQKFLTSINVVDLEKSVLNDKLAKASYQEIVESVAKAEEFRKTKEKCRDRTGDDWFLNQMHPGEDEDRKEYVPKRESRGYRRDRQGYRPRNP